MEELIEITRAEIADAIQRTGALVGVETYHNRRTFAQHVWMILEARSQARREGRSVEPSPTPVDRDREYHEIATAQQADMALRQGDRRARRRRPQAPDGRHPWIPQRYTVIELADQEIGDTLEVPRYTELRIYNGTDVPITLRRIDTPVSSAEAPSGRLMGDVELFARSAARNLQTAGSAPQVPLADVPQAPPPDAPDEETRG